MRLYDDKTDQMIGNTWPGYYAKTNSLSYVPDFLKDVPVNQETTVAFSIDWVKSIRENFEITKVIWNDDAVIVFWSDKTKTVVKRMEADEDDIYSAVAQALAKKIYGGTGYFHSHVDSVLKDYRTPMDDSSQNAIMNSFSKFFNGIWLASHPKGTDRYSGPEE